MQIDWKHLFLSMDGRIGRQSFWIGFVLILVASLILNMIPLLGPILGLALLWPQVAIHAKRLHDMGRSAWLIVVPFVVSFVALIAAAMTGGASVIAALNSGSSAGIAQSAGGIGLTFLLLLVAFGVGIAFLLWVGLSRGDDADNRFGPPPALR
jgi:uncharacterized membrane protein YhaH (DUF805 family)